MGRTYFTQYSRFSYMSELINYINANTYNWKEAKQFHTASDNKQQQKTIQSSFQMGDEITTAMAIHSGKQERPLRRVFLQDCWRSKAALTLKSSTSQCCWGDIGGLAISKRLFTGLRFIVFFWISPRKHANCWDQEHWLKELPQEPIQLLPFPLYWRS